MMEILRLVVYFAIGYMVGRMAAVFIFGWLDTRRMVKRRRVLEGQSNSGVEQEKSMKHYRQGDVLLVKVKSIPKVLKEDGFNMEMPVVKAELGGDVVLAYGEATGHAHVLDREKVEAWVTTASKEPPTKAVWDSAADRFIRVMEATSLKHLNLLKDGSPTGEHADIALDPGVYRVVRQREWTDEQERWVND